MKKEKINFDNFVILNDGLFEKIEETKKDVVWKIIDKDSIISIKNQKGEFSFTEEELRKVVLAFGEVQTYNLVGTHDLRKKKEVL